MDLSRLFGKKVLITGATGLIGQSVIKVISANNNQANPIQLFLSVRNREKAEKVLSELLPANTVFLESDIRNIQASDLGIHYIIHGASITSSSSFVEQPVEVIDTSLRGCRRILEFARNNPSLEGLVFLSSMEVYGTPSDDVKIAESHNSDLNCMDVRASYPESKRMCESLCAAYYKEYGVPAKVIRLSQTFGPGVSYDDKRVFAEFVRCILNNEDIVLKTKGNTKRSYLYTTDAANAILTVLLDGLPGEAYNAANEETYCSIYEMAQIVMDTFGKEGQKVIIQEDDISKYGYAPELHMNLDTLKLKKLGWKAEINLIDMFRYTIEDIKKRIDQ